MDHGQGRHVLVAQRYSAWLISVTSRSHDVICLGRAAVDLYGQQIGGRLEDMQSFAKYLGGSSGNLAAGLARLGVRSAMLTRVGDEAMGRFVREELARQGVDVSHVRTDPSRLTGLVVLGIGSADNIPHIFFRESCADMAVNEDDVDEAFIASASVLAITGTHLSSPGTRHAVDKAMRLAKKNGTRIVLDIDYRPVLWGFGRAGEGASRYVESAETSEVLQQFLEPCDLIVGTSEEIAIAGGSGDLLESLQNMRNRSAAVIVLKRGAAGCTVYDGDNIDGLDEGVSCPGLNVEVFNTVGAGDAFLSGFLSAWIEKRSWPDCGRIGNACGALVVARHGCTPAMPSRVELENFLSLQPRPTRPRLDAGLIHLHRASTWSDDPRPLCVLAFDHRSQFEKLAAQYGRPVSDISTFKELIAEGLLDARANGNTSIRHGAIVDHRYGERALARLTDADLWAASPIEVPGSRPLEFDPHFATGQFLSGWPAKQIVKCLLYFHPEDPTSLREEQEERVRALYADVVALERRFLLEVICREAGKEQASADALPRVIRRMYNLGIRPDWWKLEPQTAAGWRVISDLVAECDPHCKGVVILGFGADQQTLHRGLEVAAAFPLCRGFAVGRSIFADAADLWFAGTMDDASARTSISERYLSMIDTWCVAARRNQAG